MANQVQTDRIREQAHPTRAQEAVHPPVRVESSEGEWAQPENLAAPPARPGYAQRWIRVDGLQSREPDLRNFLAAQRAGWTPRRADSVPKSWGSASTTSKGELAGYIISKDVVLCEIPVERLESRERYIRSRIDLQTQTIERDIHKHVPEGTLQEMRKSVVAVGSRRPAPRVPPVLDEQ